MIPNTLRNQSTMSTQSSTAEAEQSVFCDSRFLSVFQLSPYRPYADSKTIVDSTLLESSDRLYTRLSQIPPGSSLEAAAYRELLSTFLKPPSEHPESQYIPPDYVEETLPQFTRGFPDKLLPFIRYLKESFKALYRRSSAPNERSSGPHSFDESKLQVVPGTSLLRLPYGYFVPGGRFRECYYWDTYWTLQGLLACSMIQSAMGAVRNLLYLVKAHGFVPNGNRAYYLGRSQPPMLTEMVEAVCCYLAEHEDRKGNVTKTEWLEECLPILETEYGWWMRERSVEVCLGGVPVGRLNRYTGGRTAKPRPESFKEDTNATSTEEALGNILAGCESGWDFTSRWYSDEDSASVDKQIKNDSKFCTKDIAPVCLNSIMLRVECLLSRYHRALGHEDRAENYRLAATARRKVMMKAMWDDSNKLWHDFNWKKQQHTSVISIACWFPLWAECYGDPEEEWDVESAKQCVNSLLSESGLVQLAGVATTPQKEGLDEQWDWPNGWPPLQEIVVTGLRRVEEKFGALSKAGEAARMISRRWLGGVFRCWQREGVMHEKYDVREIEGKRGAGGEYAPQIGFGWTNGVALEFLRIYQKEIREDGAWLEPVGL